MMTNESLFAEQERKIVPVCFLCNQVPEHGLRSGFFLKGIFICSACEAELISSKDLDKHEFMLAVSRLRGHLFSNPL